MADDTPPPHPPADAKSPHSMAFRPPPPRAPQKSVLAQDATQIQARTMMQLSIDWGQYYHQFNQLVLGMYATFNNPRASLQHRALATTLGVPFQRTADAMLEVGNLFDRAAAAEAGPVVTHAMNAAFDADLQRLVASAARQP